MLDALYNFFIASLNVFLAIQVVLLLVTPALMLSTRGRDLTTEGGVGVAKLLFLVNFDPRISFRIMGIKKALAISIGATVVCAPLYLFISVGAALFVVAATTAITALAAVMVWEEKGAVGAL